MEDKPRLTILISLGVSGYADFTSSHTYCISFGRIVQLLSYYGDDDKGVTGKVRIALSDSYIAFNVGRRLWSLRSIVAM